MMKNALHRLMGAQASSTVMVARGWSMSDAYRELDLVIIEAHSFIDDADRVLSRYEAVDRVLPEADVLEQRGVDLRALARGLSNGLGAPAFANALENNLNVGLFFLALERGQINVEAFNRDLVSYGAADMERFNEGLEHLADLYAESPRHRLWAHVSRLKAS